MRLLTTYMIVSAACFSLFASNSYASNHSSLIDKLNNILSKQADDKPGISVLFRKDNQVIFKSSKGLANKVKNLPINATTGFRIGSISKPFTALAIMKLVEQKKLSLEDSVTDFIPALASNWEGITLKHLLSHRVYLSNDFFSRANLRLANLSTNHDLIKFLAIKQVKVKKLATDKAIYCNTCYVLLAEVVAKASGESFANYLSQHIFAPANMKNTYILDKGVVMNPNDALNYAKTESFFRIKQFTTGAMAQVSSIDDLNNFIIALKSEKIISQDSLALMTRVHADLGDDGTFGLGWVIGWGNKPFYSHGGSQDGYQSELFFYPKHDLEVAILTNGGNKTYALQAQIMKAVISHYN
ncbi:serine hydrolase domain-containing protein [Aliikangiella sp. IMCC44653]